MLIDAGVARERIIFDPGIGFAKTVAQSFEVTQRLMECGAPAAIAERIIATSVTSTYAMLNGVDIIRVHDEKRFNSLSRPA